LKPGNKASLAQMLTLIHEKRYTIPEATVELRGVPEEAGRNSLVRGVSRPAKDLKTAVPLVVNQVR